VGPGINGEEKGVWGCPSVHVADERRDGSGRSRAGYSRRLFCFTEEEARRKEKSEVSEVSSVRSDSSLFRYPQPNVLGRYHFPTAQLR
jgi:hypothetical protein